MGELLQKKYAAEVELLPSSGGVFEITVDGTLVYSKKMMNRFPEDGEVETKIEEASC
ncbi:MAG: hypothetical protein CSB23_02250 [Deltaproteobacteria bacterium]|nr:MAG: hypothetical protein CSB23_02250 [Deltaproteobacteria bacterium]